MRKTRRNRRQRKTRKHFTGGALKDDLVTVNLISSNPFKDVTEYEKFLKIYPNVNAKTIINFRPTPILQYAIYNNNPAVVKYILDRFNLTDVNNNEDLANTDEENIRKNKEFLNEYLRYAITKRDAPNPINLRDNGNQNDINCRKQIISLLIEKGAITELRPFQGLDNRFLNHALGKQADSSQQQIDEDNFKKRKRSITESVNTSRLIDRIGTGLHNKGLGRANPFNHEPVVSNIFSYMHPASDEYIANRSITQKSLRRLADEKAENENRRISKTYSPPAV